MVWYQGDHLVAVAEQIAPLYCSAPAPKRPKAAGVNRLGQYRLVELDDDGPVDICVANINTNSVSVIDTGTNTAIATIPVGRAPRGVALSPDWTRLYVANLSSRTVSVIDTASNTVIKTLSTVGFPRGVAITPDGSQVYVGDEALSSVLGEALQQGVGASFVRAVPGRPRAGGGLECF